MSVVLLDTNVVSFLLKGDSRAAAYVRYLENRQIAISFMTVAELFQWAATRQWGSERLQRLEMTLESYLILPVDLALGRLWGSIRAAKRAAGQPISPQDAWIAATALRYEVALVTHNPVDFSGIEGLTIITTVN